jgi:hypothetical protein
MLLLNRSFLFGIFVLFALAACGGGGSSSSSTDTADSTDTTTPITVSGKAEAPGGVIAQLEISKPFLLATMDFIFPVAGAESNRRRSSFVSYFHNRRLQSYFAHRR